MELNIGSNIIRNTSGVLNVQGKEQIALEVGESDQQVLLTMDIYDSQRNHIAKLRRNAWVFNNKERFQITTAPSSLKLIDRETGDVIVEVNVIDKNRLQILQGKFFTHTGNLLEITPQFWRIMGLTMSGCVIDSCGTAVAIG